MGGCGAGKGHRRVFWTSPCFGDGRRMGLSQNRWPESWSRVQGTTLRLVASPPSPRSLGAQARVPWKPRRGGVWGWGAKVRPENWSLDLVEAQALRWPGERIQEKAEIFLEHWLCRERHTWRKTVSGTSLNPPGKGVTSPEESGPTAGTSGLRGGASWGSVSHARAEVRRPERPQRS